eukprot:TCONS_00051932-protein
MEILQGNLILIGVIAFHYFDKIRTEDQILFTDTRRNYRFIGEIIETFSDSKVDPISCLTHCLAAKKTCKSINVNEKLGKCELLGQSKLMDDHLKMKSDEGWIYYGPGETPRNYEKCQRGEEGPKFCCPKEKTGKNCGETVWEKQNIKEICFKNKGNNPGRFSLQRKGRILAFKLEYVTGFVRFWKTNEHTYWGWQLQENAAPSALSENALTIIIKKRKRGITIAPSNKLINNLYYTIPGYLHNSKELILAIRGGSYDGDKGEELRIWYVEDFYDIHEYDNSGEICTNIYVKYQK